MKLVVWALVLILIVLHQDTWFWHDDRLVLGFLPVGLFYHMLLSVAATMTWWLATKFAWPSESELVPEQPVAEGAES